MTEQTAKASCLIRLTAVLDRVQVSKSKWWQGVASGEFPAPYKIGRSSVWDSAEIDQLIVDIKKGGGSP